MQIILISLIRTTLVWLALFATHSPFHLPNVKLKDHTIFAYQDALYVAAIRVDLPLVDDRSEYTFAYARTNISGGWDDLGTVLAPGASGDPDESYIWAPHVIADNGTYYMFYTGVNRHIAQTIMLATSSNPADPLSWRKQGAVFQPDHPGMIYPGSHAWSDARDPMVLRYQGRYYLYYTGLDISGGIVGVAVADALAGPWRDLGAVLRSDPGMMPESPYVLEQAGTFYLFYNLSGQRRYQEMWQWAPSPFGPWQPPQPVAHGWAHDFALVNGEWYSSYLIGEGHSIGVQPVVWNTRTDPPTPQIGHRLFVPSVGR